MPDSALKLGLQAHSATQAFHVSTRDPNSSPNASAASILPTEISLQAKQG